jgi:hypothetical protein
MMTPGEKKRLFWVLVLIVFFFANLIVGVIILFHSMETPPAKKVPAAPAATAIGTQP